MIELQNLTKAYGTSTIFHHVSYCFPDQGLICLLGESGCGKTTLLNLISGMDTEYSGTIYVDHKELNKLSEYELCQYRKDYIGFIFQDYHLLSGYTVIENVLYPCVLKDDHLQKDAQEAKDLLEAMGMLDKVNEHVQNLSGGQKQRVAIARALIKAPHMILADEPTGALDRQSSNEIMTILKEIAKTKLVIVITHDPYICEFADEVLTIDHQELTYRGLLDQNDNKSNKVWEPLPYHKINTLALAYKNVKVALLKYIFISLVFALGILCMICSLSSGSIIEQSILEFKEKNVAFNNGYIKYDQTENVYQKLMNDQRIEHVLKQYMIKDVTLSMGDHIEIMKEKYPMPKAKEVMSYGHMPRINKKEISLSPSLAKKFNAAINDLLGKSLLLEYKGNQYELTVSGIFNAGYDDFFVSTDIEAKLYQESKSEPYVSISYDVKNFEDIETISNELKNANIQSENASEQVSNMQDTFSSIQKLFTVIMSIIMFVSLFIVIVILAKMQATRYKMVGLLYSFGFTKAMVTKLVIQENMIFTLLVTSITSLLFMLTMVVIENCHFGLSLHISKCSLLIVMSSILIFLINIIINSKLIRTKPMLALKK